MNSTEQLAIDAVRVLSMDAVQKANSGNKKLTSTDKEEEAGEESSEFEDVFPYRKED